VLLSVATAPQDVIREGAAYFGIYLVGCLFFLAGLATLLPGLRRFSRFRPMLIGFAVGFAGAFSVYFSAVASI
jgi:hypothetical protein